MIVGGEMSGSEIRVLLVCLGNICRSPMAESVMRHYHAQTALTDRFIVDSAGTSGFHAGERADPRTLAVLARHGAPQPSRSRALTPEDFNSYDWIIGMDKANLRNMERLCPPGARARLGLMLEVTSGAEVPDPYYGGAGGFDRVFDMIYEAVPLWTKRMLA